MESFSKKKLRAKRILLELDKAYPNQPELFLNYVTDSQMLCAIMLSAQSTDAQINKLTKKLFKKYKSVKDFANANTKEFEKEIFSSGFYKNKTRNIIACFKKIEKDFNGKIPLEMSKLVSLPGVGRKTANLVLLSKGIVEGIAVDTHVFRLTRRFGFSSSKTQLGIEKTLIDLYDKKYWDLVNRLFISHGRAICISKKPKCNDCFLNKKKLCPRCYVL